MRQVSCRKLLTTHFVGVVLFIIFNYYIFVYEFLTNLNPHPFSQGGRMLSLILFHLCFIMLMWSMVQSIISDPGRVPIYWGFFVESNNNDRRVYCLFCHGFKP